MNAMGARLSRHARSATLSGERPGPVFCSLMSTRSLSLALILALLVFTAARLAHDTDLHAHHDGGACAECLFSAAPGSAPTPTFHLAPALAQSAFHAERPPLRPFLLPADYAHTLGQRGPPTRS